MNDGTRALVDATKPVRDGEQLPIETLSAWLRANLDDTAGELCVEQFPSGYSNLTYLLRMGNRQLVLRRPPFRKQVKSGHDMHREYRVLSALAPVYPLAPAPLAYCDDASVIGAPFYVMERREGVILRKSLPSALGVDAPMLGRMCGALVDGLADLHAIDVDAVGLGDLGRPQGYVRRQVEGWLARYDKAKTHDVAEIDQLGRWLTERIDTYDDVAGATLVHNDYKFDNVMLDPADPTRIVAVLDWEMCTVGDPLMDLGTTLGYWVEAGDDPRWHAMAFGPTAKPGALTRRQLAERYGERTGRDVDGMLFYYCFGLLKIAGIVQQIYFRWAKGFTKDPRFAGLDQIVAVLGRMGVAAASSGTY
jgi:aminoglycoside phosphotransferase (APT) family kinase protein